MRRTPKTIKGYTAFVDGRGQAGVLAGGRLPKITIKTEEDRDGGMSGSIDLDFGFEKLEAELTFKELDRNVLATVGSRVPITIRGSQEDERGVMEAVIGELRGLVREVDPGEWGEIKKGEVKLACTPEYYRLRIGGVVVYEIDVVNDIWIIDGVDRTAQRRANLGL